MSTFSRECVICGSGHLITFHHLIPKTCHRNKWFVKNFTKQEMQQQGIDVCRRCHSFIHKKFSEKYLGRELNTLEKILSHEEIVKYRAWARKRSKA